MRLDPQAREVAWTPPVPPIKTKRIPSKKAIRNARNKAARAARRNNR